MPRASARRGIISPLLALPLEAEPNRPARRAPDRRFRRRLVFWGAVRGGLDFTSTEDFCISCHEMRDHSYADLQKTIHFVNRTGTRAICSDCHVPKEFIRKIGAKIDRQQDLFFHITGKIDTPEKYEAHRLEMAISVWKHAEGGRLARMPQLPSECVDGHQRRVRWRGAPPQAGAEGRQHDLHRLPPGDRTHAAQGVRATGGSTQLFADPNAWLAGLEAVAAGKN